MHVVLFFLPGWSWMFFPVFAASDMQTDPARIPFFRIPVQTMFGIAPGVNLPPVPRFDRQLFAVE